MGNEINQNSIVSFFERVAAQHGNRGKVYLIGASALIFLGNTRGTLDIDVHIEAEEAELQSTIEDVAQKNKIHVDIIQFEEFLKLPSGADKRHIKILDVEGIQLFVFDPYTIALSKLGRGFDYDLTDVEFMFSAQIITFDRLKEFALELVPYAWDYEIDPKILKQSLRYLAS